MKKEDILYPLEWSENQINQIYTEIFTNDIYGKLFDIDDNDVIVDMGSNIGLYSLYAMKKNPNVNKIYMVEPFLQNFDYMIRNVIYHYPYDIHKFVFIKSGISEDGTTTIGGDNLSPYLNCGSELTKTFSFQKFIEFYNINKIDILKIDIEGSELLVMDDYFFNYIIEKNVNKICGEFHPMKLNGEKMSNLLKRFENIGYEILVTSTDGIIITNNILDNNFLDDRIYAWDYYKQYMFYAKRLIE